MRLPRDEAASLAEQINNNALRGPLVKVVADLLREPDADELSPRQLEWALSR